MFKLYNEFDEEKILTKEELEQKFSKEEVARILKRPATKIRGMTIVNYGEE